LRIWISPVVCEAHFVHELVDQVDSTAALAQQVGALSRIGDLCHVEAGARVTDHDHDVARFVAGHAALDALARVALAAVLDGIREGLAQRDLDLELLARRELHVADDLHHPVADGRDGRRIRGDHHVEPAGRAQRDEAAQLLDVVEGLAQFADQPLLLCLGPIPRLERRTQLQQVPAQLQLRLNLSFQRLQGRLLPGGQLSRHPVDDAQGSEGVPVGRDEGSARVEPDVGRRDHERVVAEALVAQRIRDDEELTLHDGVGAEGDAAGGFPGRDAHPRLEPLPVGVDEADHRHRRPADLRRQQRQVVERLLRLGIENPVPAERLQPCRLLGIHGSVPGSLA